MPVNRRRVTAPVRARPRGMRGGVGGRVSQGADWQEIGPVRRRGSVTLDASGNGQIYFYVYSANHRWVIYEVVVNAPLTAPQIFPQVTLHIGGVASQGLSEGASWAGGQETFQGQIEMTAGDDLTVDFTGGSSGVVMSAVIEGTNYLWR